MYAHRYTDENTFQVIQYYNGGSRILSHDQHDYLAWLAAGNTAASITAGRFLSVANNQLVVDPNKASILAAEAAATEIEQTKRELREIDIKSIRSIREYITSKADAPQYLKDYEAQAIEKRGKIK